MDLLSENHKGRIFIDSHVHIHDCFHLPSFFDAALANFKKFSLKIQSVGEKTYYFLFLSESAGKNYYQKFSHLADKGRTLSGQYGLDWSFQTVSQRGALRASRSDNQNVFLLAGRQIVTSEKLEVLALLTTSLIKDNQSLFRTVQAVQDSGGIVVLPWGVGKWLGKRGRILKKFVKENDELIFLGDNSGRPVFWPRPKLFSLIESKGGKVLPGSDPLPFPNEIFRVASFGFSTNFNPSSDLVLDLKKCLTDTSNSISAYGSPEKFVRFFKNQFFLRSQRY